MIHIWYFTIVISKLRELLSYFFLSFLGNNKPKRTKREAALGRVPWNESEKEVLLKKFKIEIKHEIVPGKDKCTRIKEEHSDTLSRRSWTDIKFFVKNVITKNRNNKK